MAARLTQIDYDREMAFLLLDGEKLLGVGRLAADALAEAPADVVAVEVKRFQSQQ